jgi:hypothetical protein
MDLLRVLVKYEIIALFASPFLLGFLVGRHLITEKQMAFTIAVLLGLLIGTYSLSLGNSTTVFAVPFKDWLVAIALASFCWIFGYVHSRLL